MRIEFDINLNVRGQNESEVLELLKKIINQNNKMATHAQIKEQFDALKTAIADERTQILAKIQELQDTISNGEGGTVEERAALLEDIKAQVQAVKDIIPDTTTEEPVEPA